MVAISVLLESYSLKPSSSEALSVHVQVIEVEEGAEPAKPDGAVGIVSPVAEAVSVSVSEESWGSVNKAVIVTPSAHSRVASLLVALPSYDWVVRPPLLRKTSVALPVSVRVTV